MPSFFDSISRAFRSKSPRGDYPRRVRQLLRRQDYRGAGQQLAALKRDEEALSVFDEGEVCDLAAECAERLGYLDRAAEYYVKAGDLRAAAELCVRAGNHTGAALLYGRVGEFVLAAETLQGCDDLYAHELATVWENAVTDMVPSEGETIRGAELLKLRTYALCAAEAYARGGDRAKAVHFNEIAGHQDLADEQRKELPHGAMTRLDSARDRILSRLRCEETGDWSAAYPIPPDAELSHPETPDEPESPPRVASAPMLSESFTAEALEEAVMASGQVEALAVETEQARRVETLDLISWDWPAVRKTSTERETPESAEREESTPRYEILGPLEHEGPWDALHGRDAKSAAEFVLQLFPANVGRGVDGQADFQSVARSLRSLRHPNLVAVLGHGTVAGRACIVTEFVPGQTLEELLEARREDRLPITAALDIACGVVAGLTHAHEHGVAHGALGLASVLCPDPTAAKVANLGIGILLDRDFLDAIGPCYAPELLEGGDPDARSDLYAVGVILDRLLAGTSLSDLDHSDRNAPFRRVVSTIRMTLVGLVQACLAPDPSRRPASAAALLGHLRRLQKEIVDHTDESTVGQ